MLIDLLSVMTGIVGLITTVIAAFRRRANPILNNYLIIFLSVLSTRFLLRGFSTYIKQIPSEIFTCLYVLFTILMLACTNLYFRDLINRNKWNKKDLIHLIIPSIILALFIINLKQHYEHDKIIRILYVSIMIICYFCYNYFSFRFLYKNIWTKKSELPFQKKQTATIKSWTLYMFSLIVLMGLMVILVFVLNDFNYSTSVNSYQLTIASILWLFFFIKLLATPELLHGYDFMKIKIDSYKKVVVLLDTVWVLDNPSEITNQKDLKIAESVASNLNQYIIQIETVSYHSQTFRNPTLTIEEFAKILSIPIVHLLFVYKYHCKQTFVEYKKMIRIQDAIKLLETNYLKINTMDTLALEVGFSSYKPFYTNFKLITGLTPQDYCKNLK